MADRVRDSPDEDPEDFYRPTYFVPTGRRNRRGWLQNRREKAVAEIQRNRAGDFKVPTWVLATILAAIILFWTVILILN